MLDHLTIKDLASQLGLAITDLVPMSKNNEPFLADLPARRAAAEWFAGLFHEFGFGRGVHLRRIHYRLLSSTSLTTPVGAYENTMNCWSYLVNASRDARYLELVPSEYFIDRRNPDPPIFACLGAPLSTI
jgi:hypothetical protein